MKNKKTFKMNPDLKRHLISAAVTFVSSFALALLPVIDSITMQDIKNGAVVGIAFSCVRAGVKGVLELITKSDK